MEEKQMHIPEGWKIMDFGKLITEKRKSPLKVSDAANFGEFPFFTSGEAVLQHTTKQLDGKSIFLATGGVANIKYYEGAASYSTDTYAITGKKEIDTKYLYFDLLNILYYINANYFQGSGLKHLQKKDLKNHKIIFPQNPKEQLKIAAILSKVDVAISQTEQLIAKYTRIKTGLMQDLLTKGIDEHGNIRNEGTHEFIEENGFKFPKDWELTTTEKCIKKIEQGWSPNCESDPAPANEWGILKTTAVTWGGYDASENKKMPHNLSPKYHYEVKNGDVLITRAGPNSRVGVVTYVQQTRNKIIFSDKIYRLIPQKKLVNKYLALALSSQFTQRHLSNFKTGMAESQTNISQKIVLALNILLPSPEEQNRIIEKLNKAEDNLKIFVTELSKLQFLKTGLMQDLLSGKVRVNHMIESVKTKEKMM